jgi:hypothetical protein
VVAAVDFDGATQGPRSAAMGTVEQIADVAHQTSNIDDRMTAEDMG